MNLHANTRTASLTLRQRREALEQGRGRGLGDAFREAGLVCIDTSLRVEVLFRSARALACF